MKLRTTADIVGKWPVADPEPRIIMILRTLLHQNQGAPGQYLNLEAAKNEALAVLTEWQKSENLKALREQLGVVKVGRGGRRRQLTVNRENALCLAVVNAALKGAQSKSAAFDKAAELEEADDREVQRAWEKWSFLHVQTLASVMQHEQLGPAVRPALLVLLDVTLDDDVPALERALKKALAPPKKARRALRGK